MDSPPSASGALPATFIGRDEIARLFQVTPATVRAWEQSGRLPKPLRVGRRSLWAPSTIAKFIEDGGVTAPAQAVARA